MTASAVDNLRPLVEELKNSITSLQKERVADTEVDTDTLRALAHGELAVGNWLAGAKILDEYAKNRPDDFDANFSRGVAYANACNGHATNIGALRAYNDAIAFMSESIDKNYRARLFTYRGAILKRMHRFEEALADLRISESLATNEYEVSDLLYNFACVYAMLGDRERMMEAIRKIPDSDFLEVIRARLEDYFRQFAHDAEFLELTRTR